MRLLARSRHACPRWWSRGLLAGGSRVKRRWTIPELIDQWALAESCFATLKAELIDTRPWPTRRAARQALFAWIEAFYNRRRYHSALGYRSPAAYETALAQEAQAA